MRRKPISVLTAALALLGGLLSAAAAAPAAPTEPAAAPAAAADSYSWKNARIDGGGFVPGIVFNESEQGLVYARTDIGGAYRQDPATDRWTPLLDHIGWDDWGHTGVASIATDAVDPDKVYAAVGSYTNDWDPTSGAILRSADRGDTWQKTTLPFKLGGNMPGRGMGERLVVDPNRNSVLYFGAPSGNGLWRSTDSGVTWAKADAFTNVGDYAQDPADTTGYGNDNQGVLWTVFDERTGTSGRATQTFYVGVADKENSVYRTTDGGATFTRLGGQPTGLLPHRAALDPTSDSLYLTYSDTGGPYDGARGAVWKFDTGTGSWSDISPVATAETSYGYSGLSVDRRNPGTLMVTGYSAWWPDTQIFRSTDGGATWKPFWEYDGYPARVNHYTLDITEVPWLGWGANPAPPEESPKLGWMTEGLAIDPFDSDRMLYGTGATVYGTKNLTTFDTGGDVSIEPTARGLEETAVLDLASPPSGAPLLSALGDIGGFRHTGLDTVPMFYTSPVFGSTTGLDYAESDPDRVVRVGDSDTVHVAFSTDNGANWFAGQDPAGVTGGGSVAMSADGSKAVWSPVGAAVHHGSGTGGSWTASTGIPAGAVVESDRENAGTFYGFSAGEFYLSTDGGASFTATAASGLPSEGDVRFKALPGTEGDIWLAGGEENGVYGLYHSTDSGRSFTELSGVQEADNIGFGKAAPGASYMTLYTSAQINGVRGIHRSTDAGATWVRINDDQHQWGWTGAAITGDPRVYGRVYVGTNGRGVVYGDTSETGGTGPTDPPTPEPTDPPTGEPTVPPVDGDAVCAVTYTVTNQWQGGFQADVSLKNTGTAEVRGWTAAWTFPDGQRVSQMWNATHARSGADVTATSLSWNSSMVTGASVSFGFTGTTSGSNAEPGAFTLNGAACTVV